MFNAENNVQSVSYLSYTQVIKPQIIKNRKNQSWHKFTENKKIKHKMFEELIPLALPLLEAYKARTRWYCGPFRQFINTRFYKSIKKEWAEAIKN